MSDRIWKEDPPSAQVKEFVDRVREARARLGHELTLMQEAIATTIAEHDPTDVPALCVEFEAVTKAIDQKGEWVDWDEWRISTAFQTRIVKAEKAGKDWYEAAVECDGQKLACGCPTLKGAYAFVNLYKGFIIDQFYSVGPPWADTGLYET